MCYFLYGGINSGINIEDYEKAIGSSDFSFSIGSEADVQKCIEKCGNKYRLTNHICDCDTAIGTDRTEDDELKELSRLIHLLRNIKGCKYIYLSKNWWKEKNEKIQTVNIEDIDLTRFLAGIEDNCLYKIELFKRYS